MINKKHYVPEVQVNSEEPMMTLKEDVDPNEEEDGKNVSQIPEATPGEPEDKGPLPEPQEATGDATTPAEDTLPSGEETPSDSDVLEVIADIEMLNEILTKLEKYKLIKLVKAEDEETQHGNSGANIYRLFLKPILEEATNSDE
jgi:hypothetical protein